MAWIELHQSLPHNKKTMRLRRLLHIRTPQAVGHLCMLWLWALDNAPDGDLTPFTPGELAEVCEYAGKDAGRFWAALREAGFVDPDGSLHDWYAYAGRLLEQRELTREQARLRQRRRRERLKGVTGDTDVCHAHTEPNRTEPDHTAVRSEAAKKTEAEEGPVDGRVCEKGVFGTHGDWSGTAPETAARHGPDSGVGHMYGLPEECGEDVRKAQGAGLGPAPGCPPAVLEAFASAVRAPRAGETETLLSLVRTYSEEAVLFAIEKARGRGRSANYIAALLHAGVCKAPPATGASRTTYDLSEIESLALLGIDGEKGSP